MRIFVYEYTCSIHAGSPLHAEGQAMLSAVLDDLARVANVQTRTLTGQAFAAAEEETAFRRLAAEADYTLVIAPEFDEILWRRCQWVNEAGGCLLGPSADAVRLTSDKVELARLWNASGIPTPETWEAASFLKSDRPRDTPLVIKPRFGAGSQGIRTVPAVDAISDAGNDLIAQRLVPGEPASVAFLIGPGATTALEPTRQNLSSDGAMHYLGGSLPLSENLAQRARSIGRRALSAVRGLNGYVGVDLVLGAANDGSGDHAIEINPRLTTSYLGLRRLADFNLAEAMLDVVEGRSLAPLLWRTGSVAFDATGHVEYLPAEREAHRCESL